MKKHIDTMYELRTGLDYGKMVIKDHKDKSEAVPAFVYERTLEIAEKIIAMQNDECTDGQERMTMALTAEEWSTIQQALLAANKFSLDTMRNPHAPDWAKEQAKNTGLTRSALFDKIQEKREKVFGR